jgi:hypothetical protein
MDYGASAAGGKDSVAIIGNAHQRSRSDFRGTGLIVPIAYNAVKEQQATIRQQASEIASLKERLQRIEALLTK